MLNSPGYGTARPRRGQVRLKRRIQSRSLNRRRRRDLPRASGPSRFRALVDPYTGAGSRIGKDLLVRTLPSAISSSEAVMAETFAARGSEETRMEDLAEATGVPKATLYYHFSGKEEILAWLLRSTLAALGDAVA